MSVAYIHLSDIHFGQEKGGEVFIHRDAKARLLEDIDVLVDRLPESKAAGVIVTGDIAYGGKPEEYKEAANWLDQVARAARCDITAIQVVPGNHDIDRAELSHAAKWMLDQIATNGEGKLDEFLSNARDRALLYARFTSYIPFAEGYNCPMDCQGGLASERIVQLTETRSLRFVGLNSALVCKHKDKEGELLLGARQRVLPIAAGQELVVLCHHPLAWLQDSEDARRFIRSRARVFISGHEHKPAVRVERTDVDCDLMILEAGATVPPTTNDTFTYTYNVIQFSWDETSDGLNVTVHPRAWDDEKKRFVDDPVRLGGRDPTYVLGCPNFRRTATLARSPSRTTTVERQPHTSDVSHKTASDTVEGTNMPVPSGYQLALLRFFRDLSAGQRLAVLVKLGALPDKWPEALSHALERQIFDSLAREGRLEELEKAIKQQLQQSL
jgi:3',5'-cyclic AMP phosphodiesterase CpdA